MYEYLGELYWYIFHIVNISVISFMFITRKRKNIPYYKIISIMVLGLLSLFILINFILIN